MVIENKFSWEGNAPETEKYGIMVLIDRYSTAAAIHRDEKRHVHVLELNRKTLEELSEKGVTSFKKGTFEIIIREEDGETTEKILFCKGTWVRDGRDVYQLEHDAEEGSYVDEDCEVWKPEELEWCWDTRHRGFVQVSYEKNVRLGDFHGYTIHGFPHDLEYKDVEPFIGELPSFLK